MSDLLDALDYIKGPAERARLQRRQLFQEHIGPYFEFASTLCEDAMAFVRDIRAEIRELPPEPKSVATIEARMPEFEQRREKMLLSRRRIRETGQLVKDIDLSDPKANEALKKLVIAIDKFLFAERNASLPGGVLDLMHMSTSAWEAESGPRRICILQELDSLAMDSERAWIEACHQFEFLKAFCTSAIKRDLSPPLRTKEVGFRIIYVLVIAFALASAAVIAVRQLGF